MLRCISENNLRFFAQICTDYQLMYLCSAFGDALRVKAAAQHSSSELGSAFLRPSEQADKSERALHFTCHRDAAAEMSNAPETRSDAFETASNALE